MDAHRALGGQALRGGAVHVEDVHGIARPREVACHGASHASEPDESDVARVRHDSRFSSRERLDRAPTPAPADCRDGFYPAGRSRNAPARANTTRSPAGASSVVTSTTSTIAE